MNEEEAPITPAMKKKWRQAVLERRAEMFEPRTTADYMNARSQVNRDRDIAKMLRARPKERL